MPMETPPESVSEGNRFAARQTNLRGQRDAVAVANAKWAGHLGYGNDFVPRGKNGDPRTASAEQLRSPDLGGEGEFGEAEAKAGLEGDVAGTGFASPLHEVLARVGGPLERDLVSRAFGELDHDHCVGPYRDGSAGHDLNTGGRRERLGDRVPRFDFADTRQSCARCGVGRMDSVAVAGRAVERRIVAVGPDFLGEGVTEGVGQILFRRFVRMTEEMRRGFLDDEFACVLEREHSGVLENERTVIVTRECFRGSWVCKKR